MAQYYPPYGLTGNASYVNGDPSNGVEGSIPDARGFESTQREIVNTIAAAGMTPSGTDLTQLLQAVRSGKLDYLKDASTAANSLLLTPSTTSVPYLVLTEGNRFRFKAAFSPTGDTVAQISAIANIPVRMPGGGKVPAGAWAAGDMVTLEYDGSILQFRGGSGGASGLLQTANVVLSVPSQYATIQAAVIAASAMFMPMGVYGQINVASGYIEKLSIITGPIQLPGQFGERWSIVGAPIVGSFPTKADIAGKTNAQVLTLLRSRFQVEVQCIGTSAFEIRCGVWSQIANILITGDQTNNGGHYAIKVGDWSSRVGMAALGLANIFVHGFGLDNIRAEQTSVIQAVNVGSTFASAHAFHLSHYSVLECNAGNLLAMYSQVGVMLQNAGQLAIDSASGQNDFCYNQMQGIGSPDQGIVNAYNATALSLTNNGTYGINMQLNSIVALPSNGATVFGGNASGDIAVSYFTTVVTYGCGLPGGSSPSRGSGLGNVNASVV